MHKIRKWRLKGHVWNQSKSWFLKKLNDTKKPFFKANQKKEEKTQVSKSRVVKERTLETPVKSREPRGSTLKTYIIQI